MHIVSNWIDFDDSGYAVGFKGRLIHVLNKREHANNSTPHRRNVLLLGDSLGDLQMSDGVAHSTIFTIGFLNDRVAERLDLYMNAFDVVIADDGDFAIPQAVIADIAEASGVS